jgi:hypothetical protein
MRLGLPRVHRATRWIVPDSLLRKAHRWNSITLSTPHKAPKVVALTSPTWPTVLELADHLRAPRSPASNTELPGFSRCPNAMTPVMRPPNRLPSVRSLFPPHLLVRLPSYPRHSSQRMQRYQLRAPSFMSTGAIWLHRGLEEETFRRRAICILPRGEQRERH